MVIGATKPPRRRAFDSSAEDAPLPQSDQPISRICVVHNCTLAGSLNAGSGWCCCYHATANSKDWPAITEVLEREQHLIYEINTGRDMMEKGTYDEVHSAHVPAIERLVGYLSVEQLAFLRQRKDQDYHSFLYSLEMLVGHAVSRVLTKPKEKTIGRPRTVYKTPAELLDEKFA